MKTINYYRVSTEKQGRSGLGLDAQRHAIETFCQTRQCETLAEYTEVESGKSNDRPELGKAINHARITGATLVIAKLDRLSRNAAFLMTLKDSGTKFICADMPDANTLTVGIMALVAQQEREAISKRTTEALQAAKARGSWVKADGTPYKSGNRLGNPNGAKALREANKGNIASTVVITAKANAHADRLKETIADYQSRGITTQAAIARQLNADHIETPRGGTWNSTAVRVLIQRINRPSNES